MTLIITILVKIRYLFSAEFTFFHGHTSLFHFKSFTEYFNTQIDIFQLEQMYIFGYMLC